MDDNESFFVLEFLNYRICKHCDVSRKNLLEHKCENILENLKKTPGFFNCS